MAAQPLQAESASAMPDAVSAWNAMLSDFGAKRAYSDAMPIGAEAKTKRWRRIVRSGTN